MYKYSFNRYFFTAAISTFLFACVPARKLEELSAKQKKTENENADLKTRNQDFETKNIEMRSQLTEINKQLAGLVKDSSIIGNSYRNMTDKYDKLNKINEQLLDKYTTMISGNVAETQKLSTELQMNQEQLLKKQDELRFLEQELSVKKQNLEELKITLQKREERVNELEAILKQKDDVVNELKKKVSNALLNFENKGLTITQKNGKIFVSLDESLLFASGSTAVEEKGVDALKKLAKVLEQNNDINVLVEGHTDDVPMKGKIDIKDNWDLSVLRATAIVRILTSNKNVDPKKLTAAGRGEYMPIDTSKTAEARKKNRRTEIILTPKLDELFKVLENN